ncbi:MAG: septal ring lytic transglycosylase RlpA family protein [Mesorhizobium sp.]|nr:septal ring lytic transglycosylase RlpA family protein [Mesorhizobium sp.]
MTQPTRRKARHGKAWHASALSSLTALALLSACATPQPKGMVNNSRTQSKEYFSETEYGVAASPRVTNLRSRLPRGGGREQVGKPYKIKGKWYYPKEQPGYSAKGKASWYGDAFHGRLTANGEIYDMTHLTGAHPTMPLPSYARVTNLKNGASVVVRINDRGPYAHGRVVDLSKRAAEMLDYTHSGIADVKIDYVGRAPLDGHDEQYLLASYKPGNARLDPSDGMATGVMIAMAGPTPTAGIGAGTAQAAASPFPGAMVSSGAGPDGFADMDFPENGPVIMDRPLARAGNLDPTARSTVLGYASERRGGASDAIAALISDGIAPSVLAARQDSALEQAAYVAVGTFADRSEADRHARALSRFGRAEIEAAAADDRTWYAVSLHADGRTGLDELLERSWAEGATDAFVVRD